MQARDIKANLEHGYYNNVTVEDMVAQGVIPSSPVDDAKFEFVEVTLGGKTYLWIVTPVEVKNGSGKKYTATGAQ
jgi:hypothetical protein